MTRASSDDAPHDPQQAGLRRWIRRLQGSDGVHPSLDGQKAIAVALVKELTK